MKKTNDFLKTYVEKVEKQQIPLRQKIISEKMFYTAAFIFLGLMSFISLQNSFSEKSFYFWDGAGSTWTCSSCGSSNYTWQMSCTNCGASQ